MDVPIWPGSSSFSSGSTPYGFYDTDPNFSIEADRFANWCAKRLGYPIVDVELQDINFYAALEESVNDYGNEIYQYKLRDNYLSLEGNIITSGSNLSNQLVTPNLGTVIRLAQTYGSEAGSGGNVTYYTGSIPMTASIQDYDLQAMLADQGITGSIEIKRIFYEETPAINRLFDPYAGGLGLNSLIDSFGWGAYGIAANQQFMLMPVSYDVMRAQAIELSDQIRRSAFTFELVNNKLRIFPIPDWDRQLFFHYILVDERDNAVKDTRTDLVTNISNVPYELPTYGNINFMGQQWIRQYGLAITKEMLGYIRGKYISIPTPGTDGTSTQLNFNDLITAAKDEKEALLIQLRGVLDDTSRQSQLERQTNEALSIQNTLNQVPLPIYIF